MWLDFARTSSLGPRAQKEGFESLLQRILRSCSYETIKRQTKANLQLLRWFEIYGGSFIPQIARLIYLFLYLETMISTWGFTSQK